MIVRCVWSIVICSLFASFSTQAFTEEPVKMTKGQYRLFLDDVDARIPLLRAHFTMLCDTPIWRRQDDATKDLRNQVFEGCRKMAQEQLSYVSEAVMAERERSKASTQFKLEFVLRSLIHTATEAGFNRPYYDQRYEDDEFIAKTLAPLANTLYSHIYASLDDPSECVSPRQATSFGNNLHQLVRRTLARPFPAS